ncbi:hypothetical protein Dip518_000421 [Parelusimicrobium proximum]|uniref:hypothetical protein n=1 Tax=Parelusimicrobium proximum TaxID=3228953 RepID=UPI003D1724F5
MKKLLVLGVLFSFLFAGNVQAQTKKAAAPKKAAAKKEEAKKFQYEFVVITSDVHPAGGEDINLSQAIADTLGRDGQVSKKVIPVAQAYNDPAFAGLDLSFLPVYLIKNNDGGKDKFGQAIDAGHLPIVGEYIVFYKQTRQGVFPDREKKPGQLEIFVMSQCPYGAMAENKVIDAMKNKKIGEGITVDIRYIVHNNPDGTFASLHGSPEWEENVRQLIIKDKEPKKFWKYLEIRNKDYNSSLWDVAAEEAGVNPKIFKKNWEKGKEMLRKEAAYSSEVGANGSPSFLWEGQVMLDGSSVARIPGLEFFAAPSQSAPALPQGGC